MQKRRLGRTGLEVSVIGFGGISILARSRKDAKKVVRYAYEKGIIYFDTARGYGDSENKMGAALKDVRNEVVIATKAHHPQPRGMPLEQVSNRVSGTFRQIG